MQIKIHLCSEYTYTDLGEFRQIYKNNLKYPKSIYTHAWLVKFFLLPYWSVSMAEYCSSLRSATLRTKRQNKITVCTWLLGISSCLPPSCVSQLLFYLRDIHIPTVLHVHFQDVTSYMQNKEVCQLRPYIFIGVLRYFKIWYIFL